MSAEFLFFRGSGGPTTRLVSESVFHYCSFLLQRAAVGAQVGLGLGWFFPAALLFAVDTEVSCRELSKAKCEYFYYSFVQRSKRN